MPERQMEIQPMAMTEVETDTLADRILRALDDNSPVAPLTDDRVDFALDDAYRVSGRITAKRIARGETPVGWKIGFTNRTIWEEYGVRAPIWGPVYDATLDAAGTPVEPAQCGVAHLPEPRIEPEIVFRLSKTPRAGMDEEALLGCIDGIGHGFEIVQSVFPGWRFQPADTVAAFALHGRLLVGPILPVAQNDRTDWLEKLCRFDIRLFRDGAEADRGHAENVLGGPLSALRYFVDGFDGAVFNRELELGDLVTTGTLTRAFPVTKGQVWTTEISGPPLQGVGVRFSD